MGDLLDYPNKQVLGLDPPWVEGTGGSGAAPKETAAAHGAAPRLDEMTKAEMLEFAQQLGVSPANNDMTKEQIRAGVDQKLAEA